MRLAEFALSMMSSAATVLLFRHAPGAGRHLKAQATDAPVIDAEAVEIQPSSGASGADQHPRQRAGVWTDEKGRRRRALPDTPRRPRDPSEAVAAFVGWLRDEDYTAWMTSDDMIESYAAWCADSGTEQMQASTFLEHLGAAPGVDARRRRLNAPELASIKRRVKRDRAEVYRVASHDEMAESAKPGPAGTSHGATSTNGKRITVSPASRRDKPTSATKPPTRAGVATHATRKQLTAWKLTTGLRRAA